jgi:hypothetical protein
MPKTRRGLAGRKTGENTAPKPGQVPPKAQGGGTVEQLTPRQRWDKARTAAKTRCQAENDR